MVVETATSLLETADVVSEACAEAIPLLDTDACSEALDENDSLALSGITIGELGNAELDISVELLVSVTRGNSVKLVALSLTMELEMVELGGTDRDAEFVVADELESRLAA